ncbi:hypothetical protein WMY93_026299 [Mugilogobius chulae]|uniref:TNFR-Cys domain-containing protein n=1 Tax=Mugilogobius chulae TaxID=88201 RepID=A0AAW0N732_9GOBI
MVGQRTGTSPCRSLQLDLTLGPGQQITPNCGYGDDGSRHEVKFQNCSDNTFNDGTRYFCAPCRDCAEGFTKAEPCSAVADTKCQAIHSIMYVEKTTFMLIVMPVNRLALCLFNSSVASDTSHLCCHTCFVLLVHLQEKRYVLLFCAFIKTAPQIKNDNLREMLSLFAGCRRCSRLSRQSSSLSAPLQTNEPRNILSPDIIAAPLRCVLDDLDVLDELIMLLDPETKGKKSTKHLASLCGRSSNWVNYTYSLKDTQSPLKTLLEAISCRHPEWTVENLALLLMQIDRVDAVFALDKLNANKIQVFDV